MCSMIIRLILSFGDLVAHALLHVRGIICKIMDYSYVYKELNEPVMYSVIVYNTQVIMSYIILICIL